MMQDVQAQIDELKKMLPDAKKKASNAEFVCNTAGYKDYQDWVDRYCQNNNPDIRDVNGLVNFVCRALVAQGVKLGSQYFEQIQKDPEQIQQALEQYENQPNTDFLD